MRFLELAVLNGWAARARERSAGGGAVSDDLRERIVLATKVARQELDDVAREHGLPMMEDPSASGPALTFEEVVNRYVGTEALRRYVLALVREPFPTLGDGSSPQAWKQRLQELLRKQQADLDRESCVAPAAEPAGKYVNSGCVVVSSTAAVHPGQHIPMSAVIEGEAAAKFLANMEAIESTDDPNRKRFLEECDIVYSETKRRGAPLPNQAAMDRALEHLRTVGVDEFKRSLVLAGSHTADGKLVPALAAETTEATNGWVPPTCPGQDCPMCSGEACAFCGAGTRTRSPDEPPCEHDVVERHQEPI